MDTEGRLELEHAIRLIEQGMENEAWNHLDVAERLLRNAILDSVSSPHPFQGLARVYYNKGILSDGRATKKFSY